jgi:hypothetical protein
MLYKRKERMRHSERGTPGGYYPALEASMTATDQRRQVLDRQLKECDERIAKLDRKRANLERFSNVSGKGLRGIVVFNAVLLIVYGAVTGPDLGAVGIGLALLLFCDIHKAVRA